MRAGTFTWRWAAKASGSSDRKAASAGVADQPLCAVKGRARAGLGVQLHELASTALVVCQSEGIEARRREIHDDVRVGEAGRVDELRDGYHVAAHPQAEPIIAVHADNVVA